MNCNESRPLLEALVDGELDVVNQLRLEEHVRECAACRALTKALQARRVTIRESLPRAKAPDVLTERIRSAIRQQRPSTKPAVTPATTRTWWIAQFGWAAGIAAALVITLLAGYRWGGTHERSQILATRLVENHVRSLLASHLTDVASTDQHTVKPWFAGRLPFSPTVIDLAATGFPLIGGRLERIDGHPAAALVYQHGAHWINLLIWPITGPDGALPAKTSVDGYHLIAWTYLNFNYAAISDLQEGELAQFVAAYRGQASH